MNTPASLVNILLFEDDEDDVFLLEDTLHAMPDVRAELVWEPYPNRFKTHLQDGKWDLIFVDGYMGAFHAVDLISLLRQEKVKVPIIVLTGADNPDLDNAVLNAGADDYVVKDRLSPIFIERVIRYNLERYKQNQRIYTLNQELEARVQQRTAELTGLNLALQENEQQAQLLKQVATTVHNDLAEPLMYKKALELLCYHTGWPLGHVHYLSKTSVSNTPQHKSVCFNAESDNRELCQIPAFGLQDLQGEVAPHLIPFAQALHQIIYRVIDPNESPRMAIAAARGFYSQLIFPLQMEQHPVCFFEFFCQHPLDNVPTFISMLEEIQLQLTIAIKRKNSEIARTLSERRLSQALRIARMCSFTWDLEDNSLWFSTEAKNLFDDPLEFPTNNKDFQAIIHPEDVEWVTKAWERAIETVSPFSADHRIVALNGQVNYISVQGEIECNIETRKTQVIGCLQNINERKKNEFHLARLKEAAESANKAKSTFLANMSHEIRTPLNAILGFTQILMRDQNLSAQHVEHVSTMQKSGEHLLGLINDILEVSKIESGRIELKEEVVDLHELLKDIVNIFTHQAEKKGVQIHLNLDENIPQWLNLDRGKLKQILLNILSNAIKFTHEGQISISVHWYLGSLRFEVQDSGEGISANEIKLVFESFGQTESGINLQQGTGLGMPISRTYARMMGGDLQLSSERNVGTLVTLTLNASLAQNKAKAHSFNKAYEKYTYVTGVKPLKTGAPRILIADDNMANHQFLSAALQPLGFHTQSVENGDDVIKTFFSWYPDLILMDVDMPQKNGLEAAHFIRAQATGRHLPIVFVTASAFSHEKEALIAAGATDILLKPLQLNELLYTLESRLKLNYVFADAKVALTAPPVQEPTTDISLASLNISECQHLMRVVLEGDLDAFHEVLEKSKTTPALKEHFNQLAEQYNFDAITHLLNQRINQG